MIKLPKEFLKHNFKYVKILRKTKKPIQNSWNTLNLSNEEINQWLNKGHNVGIICGFNKLVVVDYDSKEVELKALKDLPSTLMVKTGSGGIHAYYKVTGIVGSPEKIKILDKNNKTLVDIQGKGTQVLCPPSIHPNGNAYVLVNDLPIAEIDYNELKAYFVRFDETGRFFSKPTYENKSNNVVDLIKSNLNIKEVLTKKGINVNKNPCECPFHSSKGGKCFSFDNTKGVWNCFHCNRKGDVLTLIAELNNLDIKNDFPKILKKASLLADVKLPTYKTNIKDVFWDFNIKIPNIEDNAVSIMNVNPLYYDDNKKWWLFDKKQKFWVEVKEPRIMMFIKDVFKASGLSLSHNRTSLLNALKDESQKRIPKIPPETWLQLGDLIYDITSDKIIEPSSEYFVKIKICVDVGNSEETPLLDALFKEWVGNEYLDLYDIMAFCMSPKYFLEVMFFLTGAGANGKGVFVNLISNFIGSINTCSKSVELLGDSTQRFQTTILQNKLVCKLGDGNGNILKDTKILKELAGGTDDISAEIKGGGHLSFKNTAKLIGCFNTLPTTLDKTNGWYRRVYIKIFPNVFDCSKHINLEDYEVEFPNLALRLLNRLKEIYKTKKLRGWEKLEVMKKKYENLSNPIKLFIESELIPNVRGYFIGSKVYEKYTAFAIKNGYNNFGYREFITRFKAQPTIESYRKDVYISDSGMVWGRLEDVPIDLTLKNENGFFMFIENKKLNVFSGYSFKEDVKK